MDNYIVNIMASLFGITIGNIIVRVFRYVKAKDNININWVLYKFKRDVNQEHLFNIFVLGFTTYLTYSINSDINVNWSFSRNFNSFMSKQDNLNRMICMVAIVLFFSLIIDFVFSVILKDNIYNQGLVLKNGKFISWSSIKKITYKDTFIGDRNVISFYTSKRKYENVFVRKKETDKVIKIIQKNTNVDIYEIEESFKG